MTRFWCVSGSMIVVACATLVLLVIFVPNVLDSHLSLLIPAAIGVVGGMILLPSKP